MRRTLGADKCKNFEEEAEAEEHSEVQKELLAEELSASARSCLSVPDEHALFFRSRNLEKTGEPSNINCK